MVVFTCGHCGESVQKPKVEKHYMTKCRNRNPNLSCMDCFKDFLGTDYEAHTKCITEEERYSGKGFTAKEKKGEKKQNAWVEMLQSVLDEQKNASRNVLRIIETISKHNNTPRKKPKFINFVKNVCGLKTNPKDIDQAWDLISVKLSALSNMNARNGNKNAKDETKVNGANDEENKTDTQNGDVVNGNLDVGNEEQKNIEEEKNAEEENGEVKKEVKLSKKQRKEEKKRLKYEAELQSAEAPPEDDTQDEVEVQKKGKKNKNKVTNGVPSVEDDSDKIKKRKRQDTVSITEVSEPEVVVESVTVKEKASKKKIKMEKLEKEAEDVCLHDQNVASTESEVANKNGKFNWHEVILSVLQKKGNELPFKRLQKKVLSEYTELTGCEVDDRIADKFIKKLKSAPRVRVDKNRVILLEE
ncbi:cell growth-regulating nucleolar protein [Danaus plexippus]|uniref:cell growth-regulating nucleolar protein n=1 Tax=Danaus plexippus TaxID=13037 RepID=UPI002AB21037|nr:cell growth-regulating nucleolar protein [Danaus plexippus]